MSYHIRSYEPKQGAQATIPLIRWALNRITNRAKVLFYRDFVNGKIIPNRAERLEAKLLVMQVLVAHMDISSFKVGISSLKAFVPFDFNFIAQQAGLGLKRVKRAVAELVRHGYLKLGKQRCQKIDDTIYSGLANIKIVTDIFFTKLGFAIEYLKEQKRKAALRVTRRHVQEAKNMITIPSSEPINQGNLKKIKDLIESSRNNMDNKQAISIRQRSHLALKLYQNNPEKSIAEYFIELSS